MFLRNLLQKRLLLLSGCFTVLTGLISAPVNLKVPLWSSGFSTALEARDRLMDIIKDKLENDTEG